MSINQINSCELLILMSLSEKMSEISNAGKGLVRIHELISELINDINFSLRILNKNRESQFYRRIVLRNIFSFIEAVINIIKFELKREVRLGYIKDSIKIKDKEILYEEKISSNNLAKLIQ